ncbi:hypothetical protein TNCT_521071 [Trichonephila clavata]|uniref:Uncharacterized protein n=1 Tax=Trichonephila clavata TaxID=2740835 RepID=A0A8X6LY13_TRICU|nr:hypothetical protein TNCT_521071 [Trichonephila clavata]
MRGLPRCETKELRVKHWTSSHCILLKLSPGSIRAVPLDARLRKRVGLGGHKYTGVSAWYFFFCTLFIRVQLALSHVYSLDVKLCG